MIFLNGNKVFTSKIFTDKKEAERYLLELNTAKSAVLEWPFSREDINVLQYFHLGVTMLEDLRFGLEGLEEDRTQSIRTGYYETEGQDGNFRFVISSLERELHEQGFEGGLLSQSEFFARILSLKYGYEIEKITDSSTAYTFCTTVINGKKYYIDPLGITDDFMQMISRKDNSMLLCCYTKIQGLTEYDLKKDIPQDYRRRIEQFIDDYSNLFDVNGNKTKINYGQPRHTRYYDQPEGHLGKENGRYEFLHGYCDSFATALHKKYGYPIEAIYNGHLTHAYCVVERDGVKYYIDARGITNDWGEFITEFYHVSSFLGEGYYKLEGLREEPYYGGTQTRATDIISESEEEFSLDIFLAKSSIERVVASSCKNVTSGDVATARESVIHPITDRTGANPNRFGEV